MAESTNAYQTEEAVPVSARKGRGRATLKAAILVGLAHIGGWPAAADAHPNCEVAWEYSYVKRHHARVIKGKPRIIIYTDDEVARTGIVEFLNPRYVKWPKREPRPSLLSIKFYAAVFDDCDWWPDPRKRKFVLGVRDGSLYVVAAFKPVVD